MEKTLSLLEDGFLELGPEADVWEFARTGGKREARLVLPKALTVADLCERYWGFLPPETMEESSEGTAKIHAAHLQRLLGKNTPVATLTQGDLHDYVNAHSKEKWGAKTISADTIHKEVSTFGTMWREAAKRGLVTGPAPTADFRYSKRKEKPPFMTWQDIETRIARGGLNEEPIKELWDCLFLDTQQIEELLEDVRKRAGKPFVYPLFVTVAHTGMRRSEVLRAEIDDVDLQAGIIHAREKKRDRKARFTFRQVDLSARLAQVLTNWCADHPGGLAWAACRKVTRCRPGSIRRPGPREISREVPRSA